MCFLHPHVLSAGCGETGKEVQVRRASREPQVQVADTGYDASMWLIFFEVKIDPYPYHVTFQNQNTWESKLEDGSFAVSEEAAGPKLEKWAGVLRTSGVQAQHHLGTVLINTVIF